MLPFLNNKDKSVAGLIIKNRSPDKLEENQDDPAAGLKSCMTELIRAIHAKDVEAAVEAYKDLFELSEMSPHKEVGEKVSPHSYDAQNQLAKGNE